MHRMVDNCRLAEFTKANRDSTSEAAQLQQDEWSHFNANSALLKFFLAPH